MKTFNGIEISEFRLLAQTIVMTLLALIVITVTIFYCYVLFTGRDKKKIRQLKRLKEKAVCDENAKKKLEKLERKYKRQRKRGRSDFITSIIILTLCVGLALADMFLCVIPGWCDYIKKDYIMYTGNFEVANAMDSFKRILVGSTTFSTCVDRFGTEYIRSLLLSRNGWKNSFVFF